MRKCGVVHSWFAPWDDVEKAVPQVADRYVFSYKPSPAIFSEDTYNPERARRNIVEVLEKTEGCVVEIILKDIGNVRGEPERLWHWAEMAKEVAEQFS